MSRFFKVVAVCLVFVLFSFARYGQALEINVSGRVQSTFVLRDVDGFQYGLEPSHGVQWRNELKFDLTAKPEYEMPHDFRLEKVFLSCRGAYDAIFYMTDRYSDVREKSPEDFELGRDDIEIEKDFREVFIDLVGETATQKAYLRLGRQIVQWGEADGFNVVNILNPQDNSTLMFFEMPEDLATPLWIARLNYSVGQVGPIEDVGFEVVAIPDIRPHQFAPMDDNMDAPYAFGFKALKAKDFLYFHKLSRDLGFVRLGFDMGSINDLEEAVGLFGVEDPPIKWKDDVPASIWGNAEYGIRLQAGYGFFIGNLYYFNGYQDDPAMDFSELISDQRLTLTHPEQDMYGASFNVFLSSLNAVLRGEGCLTDKTSFVDLTGVNGNVGALFQTLADTLGLESVDVLLPVLGLTSVPAPGSKGFEEKKVYQGLIGFDKDWWVRWLNPNKMIGTSCQFYWRHIHEWDYDPVYRPFDEEDNYRFTAFLYTDYMHGWIHPELFIMYDTEDVWMTMASVTITKDMKLYYKLTQISFWGDGDAISPFTQPVDLTGTSEISFRVGYNW